VDLRKRKYLLISIQRIQIWKIWRIMLKQLI